jgi:hypothetical protein
MRDYSLISYSYGTFASGTGAVSTTSTGSILARTGAGYLGGIFTYNIGSGVCHISAYDNTTNAGDAIIKEFATGSSSQMMSFFTTPVKFSTGLYVSSTGSVNATVFYMY